MSYLPYEDILDDLMAESVEEESTRAEGATIVSSRGSDVISLDETMSLPSEAFQDLGSVVSFPDEPMLMDDASHLHNNDDCSSGSSIGQSTILSSAPSGSYIPPPEVSQDFFALSPHPRLLPQDFQNLSTVCTDTISYQRQFEDASVASSHGSGLDSPPASPRSSPDRNRLVVHERGTFEAIANHLLRESMTTKKSGLEKWYARFTDFDWEQLREVARVALAITGPASGRVPVPPNPPTVSGQIACSHSSGPKYNAKDYLPPPYICLDCQDALVGALTLDCGCTVCSSCWEAKTAACSFTSEPDGFVWVDKRPCPYCNKAVNSTDHSYGLDMLIVQAIQNLDVRNDPAGQQLKLEYCSRLEVWRQTVIGRNEDLDRKEARQQDEMMALLIEEEEKVLWDARARSAIKDQAMSNSTRTWLILGQAAVALLAATVTSFALRAIRR
eukprot:Nitzschia sp. Nitz4//scaffold1_size375055//291784//293112//NITZ4_000315-RA/size375055-processed-gene-0.384-mRNA-1//1//CDS//3329541162//783//frame0